MNDFTKALIADLQEDFNLVSNSKTEEEALHELYKLIKATKLTQKLIIKYNQAIRNAK